MTRRLWCWLRGGHVEPIHPTYGSLENLLRQIGSDVREGYAVRIGQIGALSWFAYEIAKSRDGEDNITCARCGARLGGDDAA